MIEEVAATFDMLPRSDRNLPSEQDAAARIFNSAARAELWAAGNGNGNGNGNGDKSRAEIPAFDRHAPTENFSLVSPAPEREIVSEYSQRNEPSLTIEELGSAFNHSGFGRGNNGQSL